jgi:hypothetical protein
VYVVLQILAIMLAAVTMGLALAHALELPGKLRLDREHYLATQTIYYPGFTLGGLAEVGSILAVGALLVMTATGSVQFWLMAGALAALIAVQAIFWLLTQPVNRYWLQTTQLSPAATRFFRAGDAAPQGEWTAMRDRWERSHVLRAIAAVLALTLLTSAVAIR